MTLMRLLQYGSMPWMMLTSVSSAAMT